MHGAVELFRLMKMDFESVLEKFPILKTRLVRKIKHEKIVGTKMVGKNLRILKTRLVCMCACVSVRVRLSWRVRMHVRACKACASATS